MPIFLPNPPALLEVQLRLEAGFKEWMRLGVYIEDEERREINDAYYKARQQEKTTGVRAKRPKLPPSQASGSQLKGMLRKCATDLNRPFVCVDPRHEWTNDGRDPAVSYYRISFPNNPITAAIASMLLLGAVCIAYEHEYKDPRPACAQIGSWKTSFVFHVASHELYKSWIDRCRTDPVFKKVLGTDLVPEGF